VKLEAESTSNAPSSKKSRTEREWDQGKLKYEPFGGGSREVPSFAPSGKLGGGFGSGSKDDNNSEADREKPSFEPSGNLAKDTNTFKGVVIKYNEPPEAKVSVCPLALKLLIF
jgi:hypothetical protein